MPSYVSFNHSPLTKRQPSKTTFRKALVLSFACLLALLSGCSEKEATTENVDLDALLAGDMYERAYSPSFGPADAKVTIVEFFDPACGACRAFYPFVKEILKRHPDDVRLVLRYAAFHKGSDQVIRLMEAAKQQDLYLLTLEALMAEQDTWVTQHKPDIDKARSVAESIGLDINKAKTDSESAHLDAILKQESEDIRSLQVRQTPTFYVNKKPLPEFGAQQLYDLVSSEIEQHK